MLVPQFCGPFFFLRTRVLFDWSMVMSVASDSVNVEAVVNMDSVWAD